MNSKRKVNFNIELILVIIIAISLIFLMNFANSKLNELITSDREALLMEHDPNNTVHEELANRILDFRPNACKMIEVYSSDFKPLFRVQFEEHSDYSESIQNHSELINLLKTNKDGHTSITIDDVEEDVYFRWEKMTSNDMCLVIIYMSRPVVENLWVFNAICYIILILVCILILRLHLRNHSEKIKYYSKLSRDVQDCLIR